jgi:hypothetical protein
MNQLVAITDRVAALVAAIGERASYRLALGGRRRKTMLLRGLIDRKGRNSRATNAGSAFRAP